MASVSSRSWVLFGFGISLISVAISVFVLSSINDRLKDTEAELAKTSALLTSQATDMTRAEVIYGQFVTLNNISKMATGEVKKAADEDSIYLLQAYLDRMLFAVNDVATIDVIKTTSERDLVALEFLTRYKKASESGNETEIEKVKKEYEVALAKFNNPTTELGKMIVRSAEVADPEVLASKSTDDIMNELIPYLKELNDQFIANYEKKAARIKELEKKKEDLTWWSSIMTYLAVALQLFGVMAVMSKDLAIDSEVRRDKAENEARKAEEEARLALAEMKAAVQDADEAKADLVEIREDVDEARDLLAELEVDVEAALDEAEKYKQ